MSLCLILLAGAARASTIAAWTFEASVPTTAGPHAAEVGSGSATGLHAGATVYSNPSGNGSAESFSSTLWAIGDYYQFQVGTTGFQDIMLSWDQASSNTGPRDFALQYSTNGTTFTNFGPDYMVLANAAPNPVWNGTTYEAVYTLTRDLSAIGTIENAPSVYFRLTMTTTTSASGATVGTGGTDRADNFTVTATPIPEPSSFVLAGVAGSAAILLLRRRRRKWFQAVRSDDGVRADDVSRNLLLNDS
jgi:hypothetical protein